MIDALQGGRKDQIHWIEFIKSCKPQEKADIVLNPDTGAANK